MQETPETESEQRIKISPAARKKAKEVGVKLSEVQGGKKEIHLIDIKSETAPKKASTQAA